MENYRKIVSDHYREQASAHGLDSASTMPDEIVRDKEIDAINAYLKALISPDDHPDILEIGCGNGFLLNILRSKFPHIRLYGIDFTREMVELASSRALPETSVVHGDITAMAFEDEMFDFVVSERVIINLLDLNDQKKAFAEVARILKKGGYFICIEAFSTPLLHVNNAREELCLKPIDPPFHNRWFKDDDFALFLKSGFEVCDPAKIGNGEVNLPKPNFLSTHYFISRVFHDLIKPDAGQVRNTHFVRFFTSCLPTCGDYSPVKIFLLRRV